jgi:hypothetical protein
MKVSTTAIKRPAATIILMPLVHEPEEACQTVQG